MASDEDHSWILQDSPTCGAYGCDIPAPSPSSQSARGVLGISIDRPADENAFTTSLKQLLSKHASISFDRIVIISIKTKVSKVAPTLFALSIEVVFEIKPPTPGSTDQMPAQAVLYSISQAVADPRSPLRQDGVIGKAMITVQQQNSDGTITPVKPAEGQFTSSASSIAATLAVLVASLLALLL
jgi:hypothetical protein